jgi:hypothetical protein
VRRVFDATEAVAAKMVDRLWTEIEHVARGLICCGGELEREDVELLTRHVARIDFRSELAARLAPREDATLDGVPYRWRQDGWMGG